MDLLLPSLSSLTSLPLNARKRFGLQYSATVQTGGVLGTALDMSRVSNTLVLPRLNTQIVVLWQSPMASKQRPRACFCLPFSGVTRRGI